MKFYIAALFICLLFVFFQDLKHRQIHIALPILIFVFSLLIYRFHKVFDTVVIFYNVGFFLLTLSLLVAYMSIKNKSFINPFENYFGLGDLLFFLSITPLFFTRNFILYFIFSMLFSVVIQLVFEKYMKVKSVPLAGFSALFLMLVILKDAFLNVIKITIIE